MRRRNWKLEDVETNVPRSQLQVWSEFFETSAYIDHGKFYFIKGSFSDASLTEFESLMGSSGVARNRDGSLTSWNAKVNVAWSKNAGEWQISSWQTIAFETNETAEPIFADVLDRAVPNPQAFARATISKHDNMTSDLLAGRQIDRIAGDKYPFYFAEVTLEHPGVSIVDINDDGFDDVFVAMQHGSNLLFRNKQDGTFEECAAEYNLVVTGNCSSAIFADFDNDGDPDLFLGRPRHRAQYFVNDNGTFVDRTKDLIQTDLPFMVSSISAADYNGDGLLDVYFSTYSPLENMHRFSDETMPIWAKQYLSNQERDDFAKRMAESHIYLGRPGPPNLLLQNAGDGAFKVAPQNRQLQLWRKSFQATWNDFDFDGDPDVYIANDYGPDNFLRNDMPDGFTDVTQESGLGAMGFGMGVSWSDYDNDGNTDLYVSNMFSKAGQRITGRVDGIDSRLTEMAAGNYLYQGNEQKFSLVSGNENDSIKVAKSGWAWGAQFFDINNDGFVDIYSPNGFYTAPAAIAVDLDL